MTAPEVDLQVNEFTVKFANVNGSGSASANHMFAKAIYRMGIPVAPRNIFPSNIQGLPTWYEVRISEKGYLGSSGGDVDMMLSVNPQSMARDIASVRQGGYFVYDNTKSLDLRIQKDNIHYIGVPFTQLSHQHFTDPRQRQLFKNVIYVGALAGLLNLDFDILIGLVGEQFKGKEKLIQPNIYALKLGHDYVLEHYSCPLQVRLEHRQLNDNTILVEGNEAAGLGAVYAGATVAAWYPITPSTSVIEGFEKYARRFRVDNDGKNKFAIIQAEDEIAAVGMVVGANWNGARSFTATSGPGLSLMTEFLGLAYFAEIPVVLIDVQRAGPSTGMPTRNQQSDILAAAYASHGDTKQILLIPSSPKECFDFAAQAFDVAERMQAPVIMLTDLELGMNDSISEPFAWDDNCEYDRGKVISLEQLNSDMDYGRFIDVDGDGITWRCIPGTHPERGATTARGTSKNTRGVYSELPADYEENMLRLSAKFKTALNYIPEPIIQRRPASDNTTKIGLVYYGTTSSIVSEVVDILAEHNIAVDDLRLRSFPFHQQVINFIEENDAVFVIEQNRDAQMRTLLSSELDINIQQLYSVTHFDGTPICAKTVTEQILRQIIRTN